MKIGKKYTSVKNKIFFSIGYPLLIVAAVCTMIPLLWLLSSSFKTANEIFSVPIQWFPKLPPQVKFSPYILTKTYPKIKKPSAVDPEVWTTLKTELDSVIWNRIQQHITDKQHINNPKLSQLIKNELVEGIWEQYILTLPTDVWKQTTPTIIEDIENVILPETVKTIWDSIYRQVNLGTIEIEDVEFNRITMDSVKWEPDSETIQNIHVTNDPLTFTSLSYDYDIDKKVQLKTTLTTQLPIEKIRSIRLPVRGDASYHRLSLNIKVKSTEYKPHYPYVLNNALQERTIWRLQGKPSELEKSHIPMHQFFSREELIKSTIPESERTINLNTGTILALHLTIYRPSYMSIVWDKFTTNYRNLWKTVPYNRYFINSVFIATASTLLTLFFCSLAGFAFAKYEFKGKKTLFAILLASMMVPFQVLLVPLFGLMYDIGWLNSYKAIIIPFSVGAFGVFLMRQFIVTIPTELIDAARIDGCSEFGIYYRIILPIIKPALGALTIYSFLSSWNGYLWPLIVLRDEAKYTLPIGLANLVGIYRQDYGLLMAGTLLSLVPIVILFLAMQREFVQGITLGSVKE